MNQSDNRRKISLIYIDAGGGHRAAANALCEVFRQQQRPWDVQMCGVQELLDSIDFIRKSTGIHFQDVYNIMLRRNWTLGSAQFIPLMHAVIRACHRSQVRVLEQHWKGDRPDLVVSLVPHYNRALKESLEHVWPGTPYVTLLTDIADYPPNFWIEQFDQYVICGSTYSAIQARTEGIPEARILKTSGMVIHPRFYEPSHIDRTAERIRIGLQANLPTALVLFGGEGSMEIPKIARELNHAGSEVQLILICGKHEVAARELRGLTPQIPMVVEGFARDIPFYMELADFFIGKPGPGCISEALAKQLPVIVQRNAWTLAHERYNADWIEEHGFGIAVKDFSRIGEAVRTLLAPGNYERFRQRVSRVRNTAVYEIPAMIANILSENAPPRIDRDVNRNVAMAT